MSFGQLLSFSAGTYIFREGEVGECAYYLERGKVLITVRKNDKELPVALLESGELFGEMAIIDGFPRSASAFVLADCDVVAISEETLTERVSETDPMVQLVISLLIKRVRSLNGKVKGNISLEDRDLMPSSRIGELGRKRMKLENDMIRALEKKEFFLVYQGIFNLKTKKLIGFEALVRWNNPERGLTLPSEFIDVAERTPLIHPLGEWILEQGFRGLLSLQEHLVQPELIMSINVSAQQLNDPKFAERISRIVQQTHIDPSKIKLEVTERVLHEGKYILPTIRQVMEQGFSFAMDDFGTGYSSLTSLFNINVDTIKIDRSFVSTLVRDLRSRAIVKAVVTMAIEMGMTVVAEGIEDGQEAEVLTSFGCQMGQGYLFSNPQTLENVLLQSESKLKNEVA